MVAGVKFSRVPNCLEQAEESYLDTETEGAHAHTFLPTVPSYPSSGALLRDLPVTLAVFG